MRRRIAIITMFLMLGAIVNIAVAWGCAASGVSKQDSGREWIYDNDPLMPVYSRIWPDSHAKHFMWVSTSSGFGCSQVTLSAGSGFGWHAEEIAAGWPLHSCRRNWSWGTSLSTPTIEQHTLTVSLPSRATWKLPLRPILSGFIINTLFYALIFWLLFAAPFTARRMLRRRRGQCEKCAYPIGVSPVCTECGAAVSQAVGPARPRGPEA